MNALPGRRGEVLELLRAAAEPMSIAALAEHLGVHVNTVRFHLTALMDGGQVTRVDAEPEGPGRPAQLFAATPGMDRGGPRQYQLLAAALTETVAAGGRPADRAREAGHALGTQLGQRQQGARQKPLNRLLTLLDELGFAPERDGKNQIGLRHCPFLELATAHPEVVCPVHLGLMQGATQAWAAPFEVAKLTPFVEADRCVAQLSGATA